LKNAHSENAGTMVRRNRLVRFHLHQPIVAELLLSGESVTIDSTLVFPILAAADQPISKEALAVSIAGRAGCDVPAARQEVEMLLGSGLLCLAEVDDPRWRAAAHWESRGWLEALILHLRTRNLSHSDEYDDPETAQRPSENPDQEVASSSATEETKPATPKPMETMLPTCCELPQHETLTDVLLRRRSGGPPRGGSVSLDEFSSIMAFANASARDHLRALKSTDQSRRHQLRFSSFLSLESLVVCADVENIDPGLYRYDVERHSVTLVKRGDLRPELMRVVIGQKWVAMSAFSLMITANWRDYQSKYPHSRAYRNLLINVGELAQRYLVAGTSWRLSNFITPAFRDDLAAKLFDADQFTRSPIYSISFA
jgi:SagB-type dehydrogenase family enzyme